MKVKAQDLKYSVKTAQKWVKSKPIIPAEGWISIVTNETECTLSAVDFAIGDVKIAIKHEGDGVNSCVDGAILARVVDHLGDDVTVSASKTRLFLSSMNRTYDLPTYDQSEFPEIERGTGGTEIPARDIVNAIDFVKDSASKYGIQVLENIFIGNGAAVATDGRRMSIYRMSTPFQSMLIPVQAITKIASIIQDTNQPISVLVNKGRAEIFWSSGSAMALLVENKYPEWSKMDAIVSKYTFIPSKQKLIDMLDAVLFMAAENQSLVIVGLESPGVISVLANTNAGMFRDEDTIDSWDNEPIEIGISAAYLKTALQSSIGDIKIGVSSSDSPVVITDSMNNKHIIMPMRIL